MNSNRIYETFRDLARIDSPTFGEGELCGVLKEKLTALNVSCQVDDAGTKTGGNTGNLYGFLKGELPGPPLLFSAHMDTVEPGRGKQAILQEDGRITSDGTTILGADDISGIVILLEAITRLQEEGIPHRDTELLFPIAEEIYGAGSTLVDYSKIKAKEAYTLDLSGAIGEAANAAPTLLSFTFVIGGKASHAGFAPKEGIHAIAAAANAIAKIPMGEPKPGLTCNIGVISGGKAGNIVPEHCEVKGEIRSLSHDAVLEYFELVRQTFEEEAEKIGAKASSSHRCEITAYETPLDSQVIQRFKKACEEVGVPANIHSTLGGSDHNNFALHGIEGLVLACSMHEVHSTREYAHIDELEQGVQLVMSLMRSQI